MIRPGIRRLFRLPLRQRDALREELDEEIRLHLELRVEQLMAEGVPREAAEAEAHRRFGSVEDARRTLAREVEGRERRLRRREWMFSLRQDLRVAARSLRRSPGFALAAVLTLALGIGANTAVFSVVHTVLLRPLPFPEPDRLALPVLVTGRADTFPVWSYPKFQALRESATAFSELAAFAQTAMNLTGTERPERLETEWVTPGYFGLLGARALRGRGFAEAEDSAAGSGAVAVLSESFWRRRFGSDPEVLGRTIELNRVAFTVVGVMPARFRGLSGQADVWIPLSMAPIVDSPTALQEPEMHWLGVVGRLRAGMTFAAASTDVERAGRRVDEAHPPPPFAIQDGRWGTALRALDAERTDARVHQALFVLVGAVGFLLLIACANVANLMLARLLAHRREVAIRMALGAGRARVATHFLAESLLLAALGGGLGVLIAFAGAPLLSRIAGSLAPSTGMYRLTDFGDVRVSLPVLGFSLLITLGVTLLVGLLPAVQATRGRLREAMTEGAGHSRAGAGSSRSSARSALVVAQVALALVLLVGAGLLLRSFARLRAVDPGFRAERVLAFQVVMPSGEYGGDEMPLVVGRLTEGLARITGVESVGVGTCAPLSRQCNASAINQIDSQRLETDREQIRVGTHFVSPGYFGTLGIPLLGGRGFEPYDRAGAPKVVLINRAAATRVFGSANPIGRRIGLSIPFLPPGETAEVVGVVGDVRYDAPEDAPVPQVYVSTAQFALTRTSVFVRTAGDPGALARPAQSVVREIDRNVPIFQVRSMEEQMAEVLARQRFIVLLLGAFAMLAVTLAAVGLYAVVAYSVSQRTREIGIRVALGAGAADLFRLVIGQSARLVVIGAGLGIAAALLLTRLLAGLLYEVRPTDPVILFSGAFLLVVVGLGAGAVPIRRALRVDPARTLRTE